MIIAGLILKLVIAALLIYLVATRQDRYYKRPERGIERENQPTSYDVLVGSFSSNYAGGSSGGLTSLLPDVIS